MGQEAHCFASSRLSRFLIMASRSSIKRSNRGKYAGFSSTLFATTRNAASIRLIVTTVCREEVIEDIGILARELRRTLLRHKFIYTPKTEPVEVIHINRLARKRRLKSIFGNVCLNRQEARPIGHSSVDTFIAHGHLSYITPLFARSV